MALHHWEDSAVVVIDNGTSTCKVGFSTDEAPAHVFPNLIGRPRRHLQEGTLDKDTYVGREVLDNIGKLKVSCPMDTGAIENGDDMMRVWDTAFKLVGAAKDDEGLIEHGVVLTEKFGDPDDNRQWMGELIFEIFGAPALRIALEGVLALQSQGSSSGLVLDVGEGAAFATPISNSYIQTHQVQRLDLGGQTLNTQLARLLAAAESPEERYHLTTTEDQFALQKIKETVCYVATNQRDTQDVEVAHYDLPDGRRVALRDARWQCPEALFDPSLAGVECEGGVHRMIWKSVSSCDRDNQRGLLSNIVLAGGSTRFPGFAERLRAELGELAPSAMQVALRVSPAHHEYPVWHGGKILAELPKDGDERWVLREDWYERGVQALHESRLIRNA